MFSSRFTVDFRPVKKKKKKKKRELQYWLDRSEGKKMSRTEEVNKMTENVYKVWFYIQC